jgi:hypothetical protein
MCEGGRRINRFYNSINKTIRDVKNQYNNKEDIQFVDDILSGRKKPNRINEKRRTEIRKEVRNYLIRKIYEED